MVMDYSQLTYPAAEQMKNEMRILPLLITKELSLPLLYQNKKCQVD